jgi:hypothetical protein
MKNIKVVGRIILYIVVFVLILFVVFFLINGGASVGAWVLPILAWARDIATLIDVVVLIPLAFFKKTRMFSAHGLMVSSYIFGLCLWVLGFVITYGFWGGLGVFLGLLVVGIGVVPFGILAAALNGVWLIVGGLLYGAIITYGARVLSIYLAKKADEDDISILERFI